MIPEIPRDVTIAPPTTRAPSLVAEFFLKILKPRVTEF
jgi:hypothetical protein